MKNKRNYVRYLTGVILLLLTFLGGYVGAAAATARPAKQITGQLTKKKKNKNKNKNQQQKSTEQSDKGQQESEELEVLEDGEYTSREEVALYLHTYGHLPDNYITKKEARELGWVSQEGNLGKVAPGKSIGGDRFGNYEGSLPEKKGRSYYECDIDSTGGYRGAKRIIYSNDGWIYYTEDHYETFEELYAGED